MQNISSSVNNHFFTGRSFFLLALSLWQNRGFVVARIIEPKLITKNDLSQACRRGAYEQDILISTQQLVQDRTCRMPSPKWDCWSWCYSGKGVSESVVPNRTCSDPLHDMTLMKTQLLRKDKVAQVLGCQECLWFLLFQGWHLWDVHPIRDTRAVKWRSYGRRWVDGVTPGRTGRT